MAIYHLQIKSISRGAGRSAAAAAAYRAGERIRDERTGVLHNYSRRRDVSHSEILLPSGLNGSDVSWAKDRSTLWNAAERVEARRNSRVAREYQVALPAELSAAQRLELARSFSRELADRHQVAVDLAIHEPRSAGDVRNHHAHLLATSREVTAQGWGAKAGLDMSSVERARRALPAGIAEIKAIRERWAVLSNEALQAAGLQERVDHRSLRARGIDQEPQPHIPYAAIQLERRGLRSDVAERIRERYRARVQARIERVATAARFNATELVAGRVQLPPNSLEQLRQQAREAWLAMRRELPPPAAAQQKQLSNRAAAALAPAAAATLAAPVIDKDCAL